MGPSGLSERALVALRTSKLSKNCASRGLVSSWPPGGGASAPAAPFGYVPVYMRVCVYIGPLAEIGSAVTDIVGPLANLM